jgi:hypothetical protein
MPTSEGTMKVKPQMESEAGGTRLDSWKAIAVHLGRDVRTVQRWEKREGLPVHRLFHERAGSVYAYAQEVDAWRKNRSDCRRLNIQQRVVADREQLAVRALLEVILAHLIAQKADPTAIRAPDVSPLKENTILSLAKTRHTRIQGEFLSAHAPVSIPS